jgi:hypothetical protein
MKRSAFVRAALCVALLSCEWRPSNGPRTYALATIDGHPLPVPLYGAEAGHYPTALPRPMLCDIWVTNGGMVIEGDSTWALRVRRVNTCSTPADTNLEERHGPLRVVGDSVQLKLDRTGFVLERGAWRRDSLILMRREWQGDAGEGPPRRWTFAVTTRPRPNDR